MQSSKTNPGYYWFRHGAFDCAIISDGQLTIPMPGSYRADERDVNDILDRHFMPREEMPLDQNILFVDTGANKVLVDTGMGGIKWFGPSTGKMMANLQAAGISAEEIDLVLLTHGHPDHCLGLALEDGKRAFPNATVAITQPEFDVWSGKVWRDPKLAPPDWVSEAAKVFELYRDRVRIIKPGETVAPGIAAIDCAGHSIGLVSFVFTSEGKSFVNAGDAFHHSIIEPMHPDWEFLWDNDPPQGVVAKQRLFKQLAEQGAEFMAFHLPWPGLGRLRREGDHYVFVPSPMVL